MAGIGPIDESTVRPIVRSFASGDVPGAIALWETIDGVGLNESDTPVALAAFLERNPGLSAVAHTGEQVIGAVLCGHDGRRGTLHHLAVTPAWRGHGLARRMITHATDGLVSAGIPRCNLFIYHDNAAGADFWARHGWRSMSHWGVMQKRLD